MIFWHSIPTVKSKNPVYDSNLDVLQHFMTIWYVDTYPSLIFASSLKIKRIIALIIREVFSRAKPFSWQSKVQTPKCPHIGIHPNDLLTTENLRILMRIQFKFRQSYFQ